MGGAIAVEAYYNYENNHIIDGLIIENTFTSMADFVDHNYFLIKYFKAFFLRIYWPTIDKLTKVKAPILFIAGKNDDITPYE